MKIPCIKLREGPPKRFLAYPAMGLLLLLMGSLPVSALPTANFTIQPTLAYGPAPLQLKLDASSSFQAQSYQWWFFPGEETQLAGPKTEKVFNTPGVHDIILIVKDTQGNMAMAHKIAVVTPSNGSSEGNNGENTGNGGTTPPLPKNQEPIADFTFTVEGYTVKLDGNGSDPDGDPLTYQWKSGAKTEMGQSTQITFPNNPGQHQIILTVTDGKGGTATKDKTVTVEAPNQRPVAFSSVVVNGFKVKLEGGASYDSDGDIVSYQWQASDGQTANGETAELTFPVGSYTITLKVTDDKGVTASTSDPVTITLPAPEYDTTARTLPQVIAAGISPSQVNKSDDHFNIIALVRPGLSPIRSVTFQNQKGKSMAPAMILAGVLSNGDEFYQTTLGFSPGTYDTLKTTWGPDEGQFNIVANSQSHGPSQTYPYLRIGTYSSIKNQRQSVTALGYDTTVRYDPQVIMAGFSPAILDKKDNQFDVIAIVRPGVAPIGHVTLKHSGQLVTAMNLAGDLSNGDKMYKFTYIFDQGALGEPQKGYIELKKLWGTPGIEMLGIEVTDQFGVVSHKFPDIDFDYSFDSPAK